MERRTDLLACAHCDVCPLGKWHREQGTYSPVPMEQHEGAKGTAITFAPKKRDVELSRPMIDSVEGIEIMSAVKAAGEERSSLNWTTVVACRFPSDDHEKFMRQLSKENARAAKAGLPGSPSPIECCAPRLRADIADEVNIIALGNEAARATMPNPKKIDEIRGAPAWGLSPARRGGNASLTAPAKVLPSYALRTVARAQRFAGIFASDISRAFRFFADKLNWNEPSVILAPSVDAFSSWVDSIISAKESIAYDVETEIKQGTEFFESMDDVLRCIGFGTTEVAYVIPFKSKEAPPKEYYTQEELAQLRSLCARLLVHPDVKKVGHNAGYYDRVVCEQFFGVTPAPVTDTIVLHYLGDNELPHRLGFVASQYLDVPAWKSEHAATEAETDKELHVYNATDCVVTTRVFPFVRRPAIAKNQARLYKHEVAKQEYAVGMHRLGLPVDRMRVAWHALDYSDRRDKALTTVRAAAGPLFNPRSTLQLKRFFYEECGLPVHKLTDTLEPSTDDETLRLWIYDSSTPEELRKALRALRVYRETDRVLTTYLRVFLARNRAATVNGRKLYGSEERLGWIHPDYNSTNAVTGRYTSANPNAQNQPGVLRDCFAAPDGYFFIDADEDQLELRLAAALADASMYKRCLNGEAPFNDGKKYEAHNLTGTVVFGDRYWSVTGAPEDRTKKGSGKFKDLRDLIKRIFYLFQYGGGVDRLLGVVQEAEDDYGNPLYADYFGEHGRAKVAMIRETLLKQIPEYPRWWQRCLDFFAKHGYIEDPIWGRRRYFTDGDDFNAEVNYAVQAGGFGIIMNGLFKCLDHTPFNFANGTGPVTQTHDSTLQLVLSPDAERAREEIERDIQSEHLGMKFTAEAAIQRRWKEIKRKVVKADGTIEEIIDDREWEKDVERDWQRINWNLLTAQQTTEECAV